MTISETPVPRFFASAASIAGDFLDHPHYAPETLPPFRVLAARYGRAAGHYLGSITQGIQEFALKRRNGNFKDRSFVGLEDREDFIPPSPRWPMMVWNWAGGRSWPFSGMTSTR